jgi:hypothetical protein
VRSELRAGALGVCLLAAAGCTKHQAFLVLTLVSADQPIANVGEVVVTVSGAGNAMPQTLTYPGKSSTIDKSGANPVTLSVSFSPDHIGTVHLAVEVQDPVRCRIATGQMDTVVHSEDITNVTVTLAAAARVCPGDGGAPDGSEVALAAIPPWPPAAVTTRPASSTAPPVKACVSPPGRRAPGRRAAPTAPACRGRSASTTRRRRESAASRSA